MVKINCPVIGFVAYSGSGKTTLLKQLIHALNNNGLKLGIIKHAHHSFDIDIPGKDSYELRHAGATQMLVASRQRWALMTETPEVKQEPDLLSLLTQLDYQHLDLILVEGFKHENYQKIEVYRPSMGKTPFYPDDNSIIAIATDGDLTVATERPILNLNKLDEIVTFILKISGEWRDT